jgi:hypothetical protein
VKIIRLSHAFAPLLFLSPWASAGSQPSTPYEPAPVFENEDLGARGGRWVTRSTPAAPNKPATEAHRIPSPEPAAAPEHIAAAPTAPGGASSPQAVAEDAAAASANEEAAASPVPVGPITTLLVENYPIGLIVLATAGFVVWTSRVGDPTAKKRSRASTSAHSSSVSAETWVARYLKSQRAGRIAGSAKTGVARYLKGRAADPTPVAPETGVARYLQNHAAAVKSDASETGVAKYLKRQA